MQEGWISVRKEGAVGAFQRPHYNPASRRVASFPSHTRVSEARNPPHDARRASDGRSRCEWIAFDHLPPARRRVRCPRNQRREDDKGGRSGLIGAGGNRGKPMLTETQSVVVGQLHAILPTDEVDAPDSLNPSKHRARPRLPGPFHPAFCAEWPSFRTSPPAVASRYPQPSVPNGRHLDQS